MTPTSDGAVLALDVGGTKLAAGLVAADGTVVREVREPTPRLGVGDHDRLWAAMHELLERVRSGAAIAGVGIGCGGPMTGWPDALVSPLNIPAWRRFPLRQQASRTYPGVPVRVHNDAVCFAVAEHWRGAGRGSRDLLGVVVSTGVGGGIVLDGRVLDGATGNAGHLGHVVVDPDGPPCVVRGARVS